MPCYYALHSVNTTSLRVTMSLTDASASHTRPKIECGKSEGSYWEGKMFNVGHEVQPTNTRPDEKYRSDCKCESNCSLDM